MFAYCNCCPTCYFDQNGKDAILLLDRSFPSHVGALFQDDKGEWWHFYWGASSSLDKALCVLGCDVTVNTWCVKYEGDLDLRSINNSSQYGYAYEEMLYFEGDFSKSALIAKVTAVSFNKTKKYNLYKNNCVQKTLLLLSRSSTPESQSFLNAKKESIIPSEAFDYLSEQLNARWCVKEEIT